MTLDDPAISNVDFLAEFGISTPAPIEDTPPVVTPETTPTETPPTETTPVTTPVATPVEKPVDNKAAEAFAQMRIQKSQLEKTLKGVAEVLGITNVDDPAKIQEAIQAQIIAAQAKQQNLPPEFLKEMQQLKQYQQEASLKEIRQNALVGFQKVKETFGLDDTALNAFADTLVAHGVNPFETPVDVVAVYKLQNFEALKQKAYDDGVRAEQERAKTARDHGTTPSSKDGKGSGDPAKINTQRELEAFLSGGK